MKTRLFFNADGTLNCANTPHKMFHGGVFIDDLSKPIIDEVNDLLKPIYEKIEIPNLNGDAVIIEGNIIGYEKKTQIVGYEKKELTFDDCRVPPEKSGLKFIVIDDVELPMHEDTPQIYCESPATLNSVVDLKVDTDWVLNLMSPTLIKMKQAKYLSEQIDSEMVAAVKDPMKVISLQMERSKVFVMSDDALIYQMALDNLSRSEKDTTVIEQKLTEKIAELTAVVEEAPILLVEANNVD